MALLRDFLDVLWFAGQRLLLEDGVVKRFHAVEPAVRVQSEEPVNQADQVLVNFQLRVFADVLLQLPFVAPLRHHIFVVRQAGKDRPGLFVGRATDLQDLFDLPVLSVAAE